MYTFLKRLFDIFASLLLFLLLLPVFLIIGLAILLEGKGPIFYTQTRVGKNGTPFNILKFRSLPSKTHDFVNPRSIATPLGLFLRRWGLDELPQLWNVLKGDMSLVGPRPTIQEQVDQYTAYERGRLAVRPGITGWAQINGRNSIDWPSKIKLDLEYIENASIAMDIIIMLKTPLSLFIGNGTYGPGGVNKTFSPFYQNPSNTSR